MSVAKYIARRSMSLRHRPPCTSGDVCGEEAHCPPLSCGCWVHQIHEIPAGPNTLYGIASGAWQVCDGTPDEECVFDTDGSCLVRAHWGTRYHRPMASLARNAPSWWPTPSDGPDYYATGSLWDRCTRALDSGNPDRAEIDDGGKVSLVLRIVGEWLATPDPASSASTGGSDE